MDALEFLKERKRMCDSYKSCECCPFDDSKCSINALLYDDEYDRSVAIVERWSREHPNKTRQTELLNMFPEAHVSENGSLYICLASVSSAYRDANGNCKVRRLKCADCRKEFWSQEV